MTRTALAPTHETDIGALLTQHHAEMFRWAKMLTKGDTSSAEDLVQDISLKFLSAPRCVDGVSNIKGFLRTSMQNAYVSSKRTSHAAYEHPIPEDFELSDGLKFDPRANIDLRDRLVEALLYSLSRRRKTISASVLLLRCYHGYRITEIAQVLKRNRNSIETHVLKARCDVAEFSFRNRYRLVTKAVWPLTDRKILPSSAGDPLTILRLMIFEDREGDCPTKVELRERYEDAQWRPDRVDAAHLVTCARCLERLNGILGLPSLRDRHPLDPRHS